MNGQCEFREEPKKRPACGEEPNKLPSWTTAKTLMSMVGNTWRTLDASMEGRRLGRRIHAVSPWAQKPGEWARPCLYPPTLFLMWPLPSVHTTQFCLYITQFCFAILVLYFYVYYCLSVNTYSMFELFFWPVPSDISIPRIFVCAWRFIAPRH
jgi:hypothetical protein